MYKKAFQILEERDWKQDQAYINTLEALPEFYVKRGNKDEAITYYRRAVVSVTRMVQQSNPHWLHLCTRDIINPMRRKLAKLYVEAGRSSEAIPVMEDVVFYWRTGGGGPNLTDEIKKLVQEPDYTTVTTDDIGYLGTLWQSVGRYDEAELLLEKDSEFTQKDFEDDTPALNNLASISAQQGKWDKALDYYRRA